MTNVENIPQAEVAENSHEWRWRDRPEDYRSLVLINFATAVRKLPPLPVPVNDLSVMILLADSAACLRGDLLAWAEAELAKLN